MLKKSNSKPLTVPFALPDCGEEEIRVVAEVIRSGWLTTGKRALEFERRFAEFVNARHCIAVNSGTAALHLALEALGIGQGDQVIVPVHTFTATAEVVRYLGADPLFVDCDRATFCMDADLVQGVLEANHARSGKGRVKAVIPVHFGGHPCSMDDILSLALQYGIKVVEDAAHALPTVCRGKLEAGREKIVGSIGDVTCFSFYANKNITTGEGGMLATDSDAIADRARIMRLHGIDRDVWNRFTDSAAHWGYDVVAPGFKYNMTDVAAAIGLAQLEKAGRFRDRRQEIAQIYLNELSNIPGLMLPKIHCRMADHAWHLFVVLLEPEEIRRNIDRDRFLEKLREKNIGTSVHFIPLHRMTYYRNQYCLSPDMFPNSEWVFQRCVSLPIYSAMTDDQLHYVIDEIRNILL